MANEPVRLWTPELQREFEKSRMAKAGDIAVEKTSGRVVGKWRDEVYVMKNGQSKLAEEVPFKSNKIVIGMRRLLIGLVGTIPSLGINGEGVKYHALGEGLGTWDLSLPAPNELAENLTSEIGRKVIDSALMLDSNGDPTNDITEAAALLITTTFDYNDPVFDGHYIREQGLVGGSTAATSGYLVNLIHHKAIWKDTNIRVVRRIQFDF